MLRDRKTQQQGEYELVLLEELVPQDHFLRKVDAAVDFSFIHDMCKDLYCLDILIKGHIDYQQQKCLTKTTPWV